MTDIRVVDLCHEIHASNITAGWWTDLATGKSILETRNRPEMLMLAVSELAEAYGGSQGDPDDKLPHLPMYDVELADFVIRLCDQVGAEMSIAPVSDEVFSADTMPTFYQIGHLRASSRAGRLMELVCRLAAAMEHHRKRRRDAYISMMVEAILMTFAIANIEKIDLLDVIAEKRAFNATRADHKPEARLAAGGKAY